MLLLLIFLVACIVCADMHQTTTDAGPSIYQPFHQKDYVIELERGEVIRFHKAYFSQLKIKTFKFNRTYTALNVTLNNIQEFKADVMSNVQVYKFQSNEYREFPLSFEMNLCKGLNSDSFGIENIFECGNFSKCPIPRGNYYICNWAPDYSKFPPFIPTGRYKVAMRAILNSIELCLIEVRAAVKSVKWDFG